MVLGEKKEAILDPIMLDVFTEHLSGPKYDREIRWNMRSYKYEYYIGLGRSYSERQCTWWSVQIGPFEERVPIQLELMNLICLKDKF